MECPLFGGVLEGKTLMCLCHGSKLDVTSREVINGPAQESLPVYEVKLDGTDILVGQKKPKG
jgi:3-phenylpropionate/trans-cinnamate dioxygenase ferredoxin subunit